MKAQVVRSGKRSMSCALANNHSQLVDATPLATLLKEEHIVVGDFVEIQEVSGDEARLEIISVYPRTSEISRLNQRERKNKVVASNCDLLVIVVSAELPEFKRGLVDRYLIRSQEWGVEAICVFNKMDLFDSPNSLNHNFDMDFEIYRLNQLGVQCFQVSSFDKNFISTVQSKMAKNFNDLKAMLKDKTAIMLGQSGVGKSKLCSLLSDGLVNLLSHEVGKVGKGVHTTTWAELIACGEFKLIDSPGVRSYAMDDIDPEILPSLFPDLESWFQKCQFTNCRHEETSKGCAFFQNENLKKLSPLDVKVLYSRLDSYLRILEEGAHIPHWQKR